MNKTYALIQELCHSEDMVGNRFLNEFSDFISREGKYSEVLLRLNKDESHLQKIVTDLLLYSFENYFSSFVKLNRKLSHREKATYCGFKTYIFGRQGNETLEFLVMAHRELISADQLEKIFSHHVNALHDFILNDDFDTGSIAS